MTNKQDFNKRHKQPINESNTKKEVSKLSGIKISILDDVYDRGIGAYKSNPESVRTKSGVKNPKAPLSKKMSKEQWAMARVYSFVNKVEGRKKLNHDLDLAKKIK
jgi:hypothetical protein